MIAFRSYTEADQANCIALFERNCPRYFAPNEREDFLDFLRHHAACYQLGLLDGALVAAYGLRIAAATGRGRLHWIMVCPQQRPGKGLGAGMMERVMAEARKEGVSLIDISASHLSAAFFERFGAVEQTRMNDGWGPGMHRIDMELRL